MKDKHYIYLIDYSGCTHLNQGLVKVGITKEHSIENRFVQNFSAFREYMNKKVSDVTNDDIDCIYYRTPSAALSSKQARYIEESISLEFKTLELPEEHAPNGYTEIYSGSDRGAIERTIENLIIMFAGDSKDIDEFKHLYRLPNKESNRTKNKGSKMADLSEGHKRFTWRTNKEIGDRIMRKAEEEGVSFNYFVNQALQEYVEQLEE